MSTTATTAENDMHISGNHLGTVPRSRSRGLAGSRSLYIAGGGRQWRMATMHSPAVAITQ